MGLIAVGAPIAMGLLRFVIPFKRESDVFVPIGPGVFFLLSAGPMCAWASRRRTRINESGLTSEYMFAKARFLPWEQIEKVKFNSGEFWLYGQGRDKALLHVFFAGVRDAVPLLHQCLPEAVRLQYQSTLAKFATAVGAG